uniref:Integrator complex subunit 7 n=1 Tax=Schistocephalus solidus TaxID=70667 RepID=A0A0X3NWQ8_SCHSO
MSSRKAVKVEDQDSQDDEPWFLSTTGPPLMELKHMYVNLLRFFRVFPKFAVVLRSVGLFEEVVLSSNPRVALLCQFLGFLCESMVRGESEDWLPTVNDILEHFDATPRGAGSCASTAPAPSVTLPAPFVLILRMARGQPLSVDQRLRLVSCLARATALTEEDEKCLEPWLVYKLACRACLYRQPSLAADIYEQLCSLATTGRSVYWLQGLATLSRGEINLLTSVGELSTAVKNSPARPWLPRLSSTLHDASATVFKARTFFLSIGDRAVNWFQTDYLETRAAFLACLAELCLLLFHAGCSSRCARWTQLEAMKNPHVASSASSFPTKNPLIVLQTLLPAWDSLLTNLNALIQRCIDADLETLRHLKAFLEMVRFFRSTLSELSDTSSSDDSVARTSPWMRESVGANLDCLDQTDGPASDSLQILLSQFQTQFAKLSSHPVDDSITPAQLLANFTFQLSTFPVCLPRFFFKRLQSTSIRLVILPKPSSPSEPLILAQEMGLVLNVMGIVSQKSPRIDLMRRVTAAELVMTISRSASSASLSICEDSSLSNFQQTQRRVVPIQRDYFHTEFCLTFPRPLEPGSQSSSGGSRFSTSSTAELYRVFLEAFLLDANGLRWRLCGTSSEAGVGESILVRVEPRSSAPSVDFTQPVSSQNAALLKYEVVEESKTEVSCAT